MKTTLIAFALASALSASAAQAVSATNLLVNGSFELPTGTSYAALPGNSTAITGWKTVSTGVEWFNASAYGGAADGVMVVDLANYIYSSGGIEQSFATMVGETYDLAFNLGTSQSYGRDGTAHIDVTVAGVATGYNVVNHSASMMWSAPIALSFTANSATTTLRFTNTENANLHFAYVDGVSVTAAVPEPETYALMLAGLGLVGFAARRRTASSF
jgi:hypothetical protein